MLANLLGKQLKLSAMMRPAGVAHVAHFVGHGLKHLRQAAVQAVRNFDDTCATVATATMAEAVNHFEPHVLCRWQIPAAEWFSLAQEAVAVSEDRWSELQGMSSR